MTTPASITRATAESFWRHRRVIRKFSIAANYARSTLYEDWLRAQTPAYRAQLLRAEAEFVTSHREKLRGLETVMSESMEGYEDSPVGSQSQLFNGSGDWSWQPQRCQPDPGYEYPFPHEGMVAADRRAQLETLMPTYRPPRHPLHGIRPGA